MATMSLDDLRDLSASDEKDEVDSLPSTSTSDLYSESESDSEAQAEWERSLEQLQLLLTMMIIPFAGKYFGRKFAYWSEFRTQWNLCLQTSFGSSD
jgi:hypothetical protein